MMCWLFFAAGFTELHFLLFNISFNLTTSCAVLLPLFWMLTWRLEQRKASFNTPLISFNRAKILYETVKIQSEVSIGDTDVSSENTDVSSKNTEVSAHDTVVSFMDTVTLSDNTRSTSEIMGGLSIAAFTGFERPVAQSKSTFISSERTFGLLK